MGLDRAIDAGAMRDRETARNRPARGRGGAALYGRNGLSVAAGSEGVSPLFDEMALTKRLTEKELSDLNRL